MVGSGDRDVELENISQAVRGAGPGLVHLGGAGATAEIGLAEDVISGLAAGDLSGAGPAQDPVVVAIRDVETPTGADRDAIRLAERTGAGARTAGVTVA